VTDRTTAEKLKFRPGMSAALLYAPEDVDLGLPVGSLTGDASSADFVVVFAATQAEAEQRITAMAASVSDKSVAWVGYPKGSKAAGHDLSRDTIARFAPSVGLIVNANFSIDDTWSALRLRPRRPGD
jgi:hypothetical protein